MIANKFKSQYDQLEKFGDDITVAQQPKVTQALVAGAVAYHVAVACDMAIAKDGKMEAKKAAEFCGEQAHKYTQQEFDNKGLEWLDQKKVEADAAKLVRAKLVQAEL